MYCFCGDLKAILFFQHEEELYADKNNCINTVEEQYHREVLELRYSQISMRVIEMGEYEIAKGFLVYFLSQVCIYLRRHTPSPLPPPPPYYVPSYFYHVYTEIKEEDRIRDSFHMWTRIVIRIQSHW